MRRLRLHGAAAELFGRDDFVLDVITPQQAVRALACMIPGFRKWVREYPAGFHLRVGRAFRGEDEIAEPCAGTEVIHLIPATAASSAAARVVAGVVLVVVDQVFLHTGYLTQVGAAMAIGGVAEMLAPKPKTTDATSNDNLTGYTFTSGVNTTGQGVGIALSYGLGMSTTHVISVQVVSEAGVFNADGSGAVMAPDAGANEAGPADISYTTEESSVDGNTGWGYSFDGETWGATDQNGDAVGDGSWSDSGQSSFGSFSSDET